MNKIDTSRHFGILLDYGAFNSSQIGQNAKLLLKFVKMTERVNQAAEAQSIQQDCFNGLQSNLEHKNSWAVVLGTGGLEKSETRAGTNRESWLRDRY